MNKTVLQRYHYAGLCRWPACAAVFLLLNAGQANAQSDTTKKLKEVKIQSSVAPFLKSPTPAQVITAADFIKVSAFNTADAVRNFAGVNIRDYGGIGELKTVSVRGLGANHTAVVYDGVQISDAQNGEIDLSKFNLNNVSSITLYNGQPGELCLPARSFAAASILAINTVQPRLDVLNPFKITAGIKGGSFGLVNPYLQWQQRLSNRWAFILNGYLQNANGRYKYRQANDGSDTLATRRNGDVHNQQVDGALYWAKTDSNKFSLKFNFYHADRGLPGPAVFYTDYSGQRLFNKDLFIQSGYEHLAKNSFHLLINTKLSSSYLRYINPAVHNSNGEVDEHYTQRELYQSVAVAYKLLPNWEVSYASDVAVSDVKLNIFNFALPVRLSLYNVAATSFATGKLTLQGNLLDTYVHDSVKQGEAATARQVITPTIIATVKVTPDLQLRAFYKSIFRNPTFAEQYYYAIAFRNIRPEYVKQYDAGASYSKNFSGLFNYSTISADAYYNDVKDKIIYLPVRSPATPSVINLGRVDIRGLDFSLKTKYTPAYEWEGTLSLSYTYQRAINVTNKADSYYGDQIPYTPKHGVAANAGIQHNHFGVYYNYTYAANRYDSYDNDAFYSLPAYNISDASFTYDFLLKGKVVNAAIEVNNLFDKNYQVIRSYPMPGRSVRLTFQITI